MTRNMSALNTRYNVYFNGNESYKEGIDNIFKSNVDDYTQILELYPISNHGNASVATAQMDRAIEKCEKAIKLYTLRVKPKCDVKRTKDPNYQAFMQKEEYNTQMDEVWMLMGKAQFHKADFLAASSNFTYIIKHFKENKYAVAEARIWKARCYAEMDWIFEAEGILKEANLGQVPPNLTALYSAAKADLLLKQGKYKESIPFLTIAADQEGDRKQRTRFNYVLAQLNRINGNNAKAVYLYGKVRRLSPPFEMAFNAKVNRAEADSSNWDESIVTLNKMSKRTKYKDNLDRVYYTIGHIYQERGDDNNAIANYKLAIEKSTKKAADVIQAYVALADLYYAKSMYIEAQPNYSEAANLMSVEHSDYLRISMRSQLLGELNQRYQIVQLNDSLQELALLSEFEQRKRIEAHIKKLQDEEEALKKKLEEEILAQSNLMMQDQNAAAMANVANNQGNWYFYNNMLIANGKSDFQRRWGTRKLEDDWRRKNKAIVDLQEPVDSLDEQFVLDEPSSSSRTPQDLSQKGGSLVETDVEYYLKQLPSTPEKVEASNKQIADALYDMGLIYKESLEDIPMAVKTFEELERRFPADNRLPDVYYYLYQIFVKTGDTAQADYYRNQIIERYPESTYAMALSQPDYYDRMQRMYAEQDSLYKETYFAYLKNNYSQVISSSEKMKAEYPLTPLMPKFRFVSALSEGKKGNTAKLKTDLEEIVKDYPSSDVTPMAKDILALIKQGNEVQEGSSHGSMLDLRDKAISQISDTLAEKGFDPDKIMKHSVVIKTPANLDINKLQFDVASYNFTVFMVKSFDIQIARNKAYNLLKISYLDDFEEAQWYLGELLKNKDVNNAVEDANCTSYVISETNAELIDKGLSLDEYISFYENELLVGKDSIDSKVILEPSLQTEGIADSTTVTADSVTLKANSKAVVVEVPQKETVPEGPVTIEETVKPVVKEGPKNIKKPTSSNATPKSEVASKKGDSVLDLLAEIEAGMKSDTTRSTKSETTVTKDEDRKVPESKPDLPVLNANFEENLLAPHAYAILITNGKVDFAKVKSLFDDYNEKNFVVANLQVSESYIGNTQVLLVNGFSDAYSAKNYMFSVLRNRELFADISNQEYRAVLISEYNLEELSRTNAVQQYIEFSRSNYMK